LGGSAGQIADSVAKLTCPLGQQSNAFDNFLMFRFWLAEKCVAWLKMPIYKG
jgi:hypothetical protein